MKIFKILAYFCMLFAIVSYIYLLVEINREIFYKLIEEDVKNQEELFESYEQVPPPKYKESISTRLR